MKTQSLSKIAVTVVTLVLVGLTAGASVARASPDQQQIYFRFSTATFGSILGGQVSGQADLSGPIGADQSLSRLDGTLNFPLKDKRLTVSATGPTQYSTFSYQQQWFEWVCNPDCSYVVHTYTVTNESWTAPMKIRFAAMDGNGNLAWSSNHCTGECPPWFFSGGSSSLNGTVVGAQDAGFLSMWGPKPVIQ